MSSDGIPDATESRTAATATSRTIEPMSNTRVRSSRVIPDDVTDASAVTAGSSAGGGPHQTIRMPLSSLTSKHPQPRLPHTTDAWPRLHAVPRAPLARRIALSVVVLIVIAFVAVTILAVSTIRRSFPEMSGTLEVEGLSGQVNVSRDARGVPTIYADTAADLFRAQGYVSAQDRFFEMDLRRHITAGRLSELVGEAGVGTDRVIRTMGWRRVAEQELPTLAPETRQYLQAYADGVNAYLKQAESPADVSRVPGARLARPGYRVEPWTPVDSLAWLKAMAWDLKADYDDELARARLSRGGRTSEKQINAALPALPVRPQPADPLRAGLEPIGDVGGPATGRRRHSDRTAEAGTGRLRCHGRGH